MKLFANERHEAKLKTFRLYCIVRAVETGVPHVLEKTDPPIRAASS